MWWPLHVQIKVKPRQLKRPLALWQSCLGPSEIALAKMGNLIASIHYKCVTSQCKAFQHYMDILFDIPYVCSIELWSTTIQRLGIHKENPMCSADYKWNFKYNQSEFVAYEASKQLCAWPKVKYNLQSANYVHDIAMNCVDMVFAICIVNLHNI